MPDVTINVTSGNQVEGQKLDADLQAQLWGTASDAEKVIGTNEAVRKWLALILSWKNGWTFSNAEAYVDQHTTTIS